MSRRAKAAHVLAKLREELGLYQKELADKAGLSRRTIQDVERGKLRLSRRSAARISERFNVDIKWLLANDPDRPIRAVGGGTWTPKDQAEMSAFLEKLNRDQASLLRPMIAAGVARILLQDYLRFRDFFQAREFRDPFAFSNWHNQQSQAWTAFLKSNPALDDGHDEKFPPVVLSHEALKSIKDDIEAVSSLIDAVAGKKSQK